MKKFLSIGFCFFLAVFCLAQQESSLCINEIMQSNVDCLLLEHEYPDSWIELYNSSSSSIDIKGYTLKNNKGDSYTIPTSTKIAAKGYLIIPCDKLGSGSHTNFRLESTENGSISLEDASGKKIDELQYEAMIAPNIAYGRKVENKNTVWGWELTATPNKENQTVLSTILLPNPVFSISGHVMEKAENLVIKLPDVDLPADTKIYATIDGSEPTAKAPFCGKELSFHISRSTNIRAKLISSSALSPRSLCNSYVFHPRKTEIPIISITADSLDFYSKNEGFLWFIDRGKDNSKNNFQKTWRRPMNAEFLGTTGQAGLFNQNGEIAIAGQASRYISGQPALKLFANKRFGMKRYNGKLWEEDKPNVTKVKSFMLRSGGNTQLGGRINDAVVQKLFGTHVSNLDYQAYSPAIVYINGKYNGIYGIRERSNEDYVEANFDGLEDIEILDQTAYLKSAARENTSFKNVYTLYKSNTSKYSDFEAVIDIDNFMKTMIVEMFATNSDWPHNNISMWKKNSADGKWRWILKDLDYFATANWPSFDMFKFLLGNEKNGKAPTDVESSEYKELQTIFGWSANNKEAFLIYQKLIEFEPFREKFIDLFATYLGDFLKPEISSSLAKKTRAEIETEIKETSLTFEWNKLYGQEMYESSSTFWGPFVSQSLSERPANIYKQMADFFELGTVIKMSLLPKNSQATINDVSLTEGDFHGAYFSDRELRISAEKKGTRWSMETFKNGKSVKKTSFDKAAFSLKLKDYAGCDSVSFSAIIEKSDFDRKLDELAISIDKCQNLSNQATIAIAEPQYAYANITGTTTLPSSKEDNLHAYIDLFDNKGNYLRKKILLNLQGSSSTEKKNLSIQFCEDDWIGEETPNIVIGDWVGQDEFHLKAFYEDGLRGTAEVAYQLYAQITERDNCYPKAFPVSIYLDGNFYGIMSWQLKKHRDNMGLDKKNDAHVWLDGTLNDKQIFQGNIGWQKFEVRNPKDLYNQDGTLYDGDNPQEIMGSNSPAYDASKGKMVRTANAKQNITKLSNYCLELNKLKEKGATKKEIRAAIQARFDVEELINYKIFSLVSNNYDGFSSNWQWFTRDGEQWTVAPYDCNLTFGYNEDGTSLWDASQSSKKYDYEMLKSDSVGPMLWIKDYFWDDIKVRYAQLRNDGTINAASITALAQTWYSRIGDTNYTEEWKRWPNSPCVKNFKDSPARFEEWITKRIELEDDYLGYHPDINTYELTITETEWTTICLPFSFQIPENVIAYTVTGIASDGYTLTLEDVTMAEANKPYLLNGPQAKYELSGEVVYAQVDNPNYLKNGLLIGSLTDTYAPVGSYVMQNNKVNGLGFYAVNSDKYIVLPANRAYLSTTNVSSLGHFRISDEVLNIKTFYADDNQPISNFNYWGQKSNNGARGFQIRRMPDGSFQKVFINK